MRTLTLISTAIATLFALTTTANAESPPEERRLLRWGFDLGATLVYTDPEGLENHDYGYFDDDDDDDVPPVGVNATFNGFVGLGVGGLQKNGNHMEFLLGYQPGVDYLAFSLDGAQELTHRHMLSLGLRLNEMRLLLGGGLMAAHDLRGHSVVGYSISFDAHRLLGRRGVYMTLPLRVDVVPSIRDQDGYALVRMTAGLGFGWMGLE